MLGWALCACAGDAGPQAEITCDEFCARHLDCKADPDIRCPTVCAIAQERCLELAEEYAACLLARPDSDFECNDADVTRPKAGVCEHEFDALAECAEGVLMMD
jgi:hypothetical protein